MNEWRWKNQYIELINQKRDRIFSVTTPEEREQTKTRINSLGTAYDAIVCELGSGSGGHLICHAEHAPRTLFIGFELRFKRAFRTIEKAEERGLTNLYMIQGDARTIDEIFDSEQLSGLYINFPDPWAKKRWQKHRMITRDFLLLIGSKLRDGGFFSHKTDHREYFLQTVDCIKDVPILAPEFISEDLHKHPTSAGLMQSEFEKLFISKGLPVHYLHALKVPHAKASTAV